MSKISANPAKKGFLRQTYADVCLVSRNVTVAEEQNDLRGGLFPKPCFLSVVVSVTASPKLFYDLVPNTYL